jgi:hypothetical protein
VIGLWAVVALGQVDGGTPEAAPEAKAALPIHPGAKPDARADANPIELKLAEWLGRLKIWGWANVYAFPYYEPKYPDANKNLFRVRFARLVLDFTPHQDVAVRLHLAGEQASSALFFDYFVTWKHFRFANVTVGQHKIALGASVMQSGFDLVMLERPKFITQWTKQNFRDIGVTIHSARGGSTKSVFEYSLGLYNGTGRVPFANNAPNRSNGDVLGAARLVFNPAPLFLGQKASLALGVTGAVESTDVSPDATTARNNLGMAAIPWNTARTTALLGADLNVSGIGGLWLQTEIMWLNSLARPEGSSRRMLGWYLEVGYTLPVLEGLLQPVARFEWADPDLSAVDNEEVIGSAGVNVRPTPWLLASIFYARSGLITATGVPQATRVELRLQVKY